MHARLMSTSQWQQDTNWTREAEAAGILELGAFVKCLRGTGAHQRLQVSRALADTLSVPGTPVFVSLRGVHRGLASASELLALAAHK